jgi:YHS domain-containing protein
MKILAPLLLILCAVLCAAAPTQEKAAPPPQLSADPAADAKVVAAQLPSYPLTTCPVSNEDLAAMGKPLDLVHEGRLVRLCCKSCVREFKKDPAHVLATIDTAVIKAQGATYPLKTCPVSGEELGSMGAPLDVVHGTRLVRLCCKGCQKGFQKDPAKAMAQVDAAWIAAQKDAYPLKTCLACNKALEGAGHDHLYGTRLTRFCSPACVATFEKEPAKYLPQLETARK